MDTIPVAARDATEFQYGLSYLQRKGLFRPTQNIDCLFKQASTLSSLISLAARMQYKQVVLCGVDLNHSESSLEFQPRSARHATITPMPWKVLIDNVILRQVLDPSGIELYVENQSSALWPRVPQAPEAIFAGATCKPSASRP